MKPFYTIILISTFLLIKNQATFGQCGNFYAQNTSSAWKGTTPSTITYSYDGASTQTNNLTYSNGSTNFYINNSGADTRLAKSNNLTNGYTISFNPAVKAEEIGFYIEDLDVVSNGSSATTSYTFSVNGVASSNDFSTTNIAQPVSMSYAPATGKINSAGNFNDQGICLIGSGTKLVTSITVTSIGVSVNDLVAYSFFARTCTVLPVKFISFSGVENRGNINLNWKVANESNIKFYSIERSINGINFEPVGFKLYNNSNIGLTKDYFFTDSTISLFFNNTIYYRIKQIDTDGRFLYSTIITFNLKNNDFDFIIYPNPIQENLFVNIKSSKSESTIISIINTVGQIVISQKINIVKGNNSFNINQVEKLAKGIYTISIKLSDQMIITEKLIKL